MLTITAIIPITISSNLLSSHYLSVITVLQTFRCNFLLTGKNGEERSHRR